MSDLSTIKVLRQSLDLLKRKGWSKGCYARDAAGWPCSAVSSRAASYCVVGATIAMTCDSALALNARVTLMRALPQGWGGGVSAYNDDPRTNFGHIRALFGKAIIQATFDYVCTYLLAQTEECVRAQHGSCVYMNDKGNKCAIGCLLPDSVAQKYADVGGVRILLAKSSEARECLKGIPIKLLLELQEVHDLHSRNDKAKIKMREELIAIAKQPNYSLRTDRLV